MAVPYKGYPQTEPITLCVTVPCHTGVCHKRHRLFLLQYNWHKTKCTTLHLQFSEFWQTCTTIQSQQSQDGDSTCPIAVNALSPPSPHTAFCHHRLVLLSLECRRNVFIQDAIFYVWLIDARGYGTALSKRNAAQYLLCCSFG